MVTLYPNTAERVDVLGRPRDFPTSQLEAVYDHSLIINPSLGMFHQEVHPCRAISIGSVETNTSLYNDERMNYAGKGR